MPQPSAEQSRSYWDTYTPVKNDGKKSASFSNYPNGMYGYEMNGHMNSEQPYAVPQPFFKPAALTGHLASNNSMNGNANSPTQSQSTNNAPNSSSIFNSPNVQLPPLMAGAPYDYSAYGAPMFRQPFPPHMNYGPMQPVTGYAYLAQGFTPMPAYPIPSPQSNFSLGPPPLNAAPNSTSPSTHFQRPEEYYNNANNMASINNNPQNRK